MLILKHILDCDHLSYIEKLVYAEKRGFWKKMEYLIVTTARESCLQCSRLPPCNAVICYLIRKARKPSAAFCYSVPVIAKRRTQKTKLPHVATECLLSALKRGLSIIVCTERGIKTWGWPACSAVSAGYPSQDLAVTHPLILPCQESCAVLGDTRDLSVSPRLVRRALQMAYAFFCHS